MFQKKRLARGMRNWNIRLEPEEIKLIQELRDKQYDMTSIIRDKIRKVVHEVADAERKATEKRA